MIKITAAGTVPDAWQELCLIGLIPAGSTEIQLAGMTEDITAMDWMEKPMEGIQLVSGGHIKKFGKLTDESITLKVYDTKADDLAVDSVVQLFNPQTSSDITQPIVVNNTVTRKSFGIILLWAEDLELVATAGALPAAGKAAWRTQIVNAQFVSCKPSFDDKIKSAEITFKWTPFTKARVSNKREESTDGSVQLAAAITTATGF